MSTILSLLEVILSHSLMLLTGSLHCLGKGEVGVIVLELLLHHFIGSLFDLHLCHLLRRDICHELLVFLVITAFLVFEIFFFSLIFEGSFFLIHRFRNLFKLLLLLLLSHELFIKLGILLHESCSHHRVLEHLCRILDLHRSRSSSSLLFLGLSCSTHSCGGC